MKGAKTAATPFASRLAPWAPALIWASGIFFLSAQSHPPQAPGVANLPFIDKFEHLAEYGVFGALLYLALRRSQFGGALRPPELDARLAVVIAAVYGATDEFHQAFVPFRQADPADFAVDALAALLVVFLLLALSRRKGRAGNPAPKG